MLQAIVHWSLRFRGIIIALALVVLAYGVWTASRAKLDVFPDFVPLLFPLATRFTVCFFFIPLKIK